MLSPEQSPIEHPGYVYFIACDAVDLIKIGWTQESPERRRRSLESCSPVRLELVAFQQGSIYDERALHARFDGLRSHGEWFRPGTELIDFIRTEIAVVLRLPRGVERLQSPRELTIDEWGLTTYVTLDGRTDSVYGFTRQYGEYLEEIRRRLEMGFRPGYALGFDGYPSGKHKLMAGYGHGFVRA